MSTKKIVVIGVVVIILAAIGGLYGIQRAQIDKAATVEKVRIEEESKNERNHERWDWIDRLPFLKD